MASRALPVHLCLDVEPDEREVAGQPEADWSGTEPFLALIERFRADAGAAGFPVHLNWFLRQDPQVREAYGRADYAYHQFRDQWEQFRAHGDAFGSHVHAWHRLGDRWVADHGDRSWVGRCVEESLDAYEKVFGQPPCLFRFGDHFMSNDVVRRLERRGVRYDLSLEPGLKPVDVLKPGEAASGQLPDYCNLPRQPYAPSRLDYRKPARWWPRRIRMIPVSTGVADGEDVPGWGRGIYTPLNLALDTAWMTRVSDAVLADPATTHLVWVARTGDFGLPEFRANMQANLAYLAARGLRFVRPDEVWG